MSRDLYIRVVRQGDICRASIVVRGIHIVTGEARVHKEDPDPEGTSITRALHEFHKAIGKDIRRSRDS